MSIKSAQYGFTLMEMIIAIVIISVGVTGVLTAYIASVRGSSDALVGKQLVAIAEEMMEEILLKPYAPPSGSTAAGANGASDCNLPGAIRTNYDEVSDYNTYQTPNICAINGAPIVGLAGYRVAVTVQSTTFGNIPGTLHIRVTASRGNQSFTLDGFRTDYATQ